MSDVRPSETFPTRKPRPRVLATAVLAALDMQRNDIRPEPAQCAMVDAVPVTEAATLVPTATPWNMAAAVPEMGPQGSGQSIVMPAIIAAAPVATVETVPRGSATRL